MEIKKNEFNYGREILHLIIYFAVIISFVFLIHHFIGRHVEVSGSSMEDTLHNKDHLILEKVSYYLNDPKRFDIIVFQPYKDEKNLYYIKRIIGLPGETVQIIGGEIYIDGKVLIENYGRDEILDPGIAKNKLRLGKNEYFLLGDNRNNSKDSRDSSIGVVSRTAILGRAWMRIWPLNKIGVLEHR
jgi:signal peptidase I, bacterial type